MARTKPSKQLSKAQIERFLAAAEAMHKSIVGPLLDYHCEHYRALREVHEPLLKSIEKITGKKAPFIQSSLTGPAQSRSGVQAAVNAVPARQATGTTPEQR